MRLMTKAIARRRTGIVLVTAWIGKRQQELSDRVHAAGDERARQQGWNDAKTTRRFGFGARRYRDSRFEDRRRQLSAGVAQLDERDHCKVRARE
jgi:hypothetical protein